MPAIVQARVPTKATLRKYGLTAEDWLKILNSQGGVCAVCKNIPDNGRLCTDHEHVKGWKKLAPEQRKLYVRGLLCYFCNHWYVGRAINIFKAKNTLAYLEAFEKVKPCQVLKTKAFAKRKSKQSQKPKLKGDSSGQSSVKSGTTVKPVRSIKLDTEFA